MKNSQWTAVDRYISDLLLPTDPILDAALEANRAAGLPAIDVSPVQGKLLQLLARSQGARRILEIGTLGGYSTIWLVRALPPDGRLITLEANLKHAEVARANIKRAGLDHLVDLRVGPAQDTLPELLKESAAPFDFIFIDADKTGYPEYLKWSLKLSRVGTMIIADNVVREGAITDSDGPDQNVRGVRHFFELLAAEPRLSATVLQTVGSKKYDGMAFALVVS